MTNRGGNGGKQPEFEDDDEMLPVGKSSPPQRSNDGLWDDENNDAREGEQDDGAAEDALPEEEDVAEEEETEEGSKDEGDEGEAAETKDASSKSNLKKYLPFIAAGVVGIGAAGAVGYSMLSGGSTPPPPAPALQRPPVSPAAPPASSPPGTPQVQQQAPSLPSQPATAGAPMPPNGMPPVGMAPNGMPPGMAPGMPPGMPPGMAPGMPPGMPPGMAPGMPPGMAPGMPQGGAPVGQLPPGLTPNGMAQPPQLPPALIPQAGGQGLAQPSAMPGDLPSAIPSPSGAAPGGLPAAALGGMPTPAATTTPVPQPAATAPAAQGGQIRIVRSAADVPNGWFARIGEIPDNGERVVRVGLEQAEPRSAPKVAFLAEGSTGSIWRLALGPFLSTEDANAACTNTNAVSCRVVPRSELVRVAAAAQAAVQTRASSPLSEVSAEAPPSANAPLASAAPTVDLATLSRSAPPALPGPAVRILGSGERPASGFYAWFASIPASGKPVNEIRALLSRGRHDDPPRVIMPAGTASEATWRLALGPFPDRSRTEQACRPIMDGGGTCIVRDAAGFFAGAANDASRSAQPAASVRPVTPVASAAPAAPVPRPAVTTSRDEQPRPVPTGGRSRTDYVLRAVSGEEAYVSPSDGAFDRVVPVRRGDTLPDRSRVVEIRSAANGWEVVTDRGVIRSE